MKGDVKISTLLTMAGNSFLLLSEFPWIPYTLPTEGTGGILGPAQLLLLCPEDPLLQSLVEGPQELTSCQHTVTNSLDREERRH